MLRLRGPSDIAGRRVSGIRWSRVRSGPGIRTRSDQCGRARSINAPDENAVGVRFSSQRAFYRARRLVAQPRSEPRDRRQSVGGAAQQRQLVGRERRRRHGTAPRAETIEGTESAIPLMPWTSSSTVLTGRIACSSRRTASTMRALERPIA